MRCVAQLAQQPDILSMYLFNGNSEANFKRQLEQGVNLRIARIAEEVGLNAEQLKKIELAAHGDLSRFYRELDDVRERTKRLNPQNNADMQKAWQEIMPLQQRVTRGVLDEKSLLERVLLTVLSQEQQKKHEQFMRKRQIACYTAVLRMTIADMEKSLPLTSKQRSELIKLLEGCEFPSSADRNVLPYVGWAMLSKLKPQDTAEILDEQQQKTFIRLKAQQAGMVRMFKW